MLYFAGYVNANFVPSVRAHFCRTNGRQLTFTTTATKHPSHIGYKALLASTNNLEICLGLCCKASWCRHAYLVAGKCFGSSCYGGECGKTTPVAHSHTIAELQGKKLHHRKSKNGKF